MPNKLHPSGAEEAAYSKTKPYDEVGPPDDWLAIAGGLSEAYGLCTDVALNNRRLSKQGNGYGYHDHDRRPFVLGGPTQPGEE